MPFHELSEELLYLLLEWKRETKEISIGPDNHEGKPRTDRNILPEFEVQVGWMVTGLASPVR